MSSNRNLQSEPIRFDIVLCATSKLPKFMILKSISVSNIGPFYGAKKTQIEIERSVTVLSGANDTGKSTILNLIALICRPHHATEDLVNIYRILESDDSWKVDQCIGCEIVFEVTEYTASCFSIPTSVALKVGTDVVVTFRLAPKLFEHSQVSIEFPSTQTKFDSQIMRMPKVVYLPLNDGINSSINLRSPNVMEQALLKLAFGQNTLSKLESLSEQARNRQMRIGGETLTAKLANLLPATSNLRFQLQYTGSADAPKINIELHDGNFDKLGATTGLHLRGSGLKRIISCLIMLFDIDTNSEQVYILFDEPENSLHADAQHSLRRFLENLATNERIQVIYATHSPSMINNMRPNSIRLFQKVEHEGRSIIQVDNRPFSESFFYVRSSLGLTPSDSLLYAPVTIVVEGDTECVCIPILLERLCDSNILGFEEIQTILPMIHFLDGQGDNYERKCRLAKSQRSKVIIFVDGDKIRQVEQHKVREKHPDVPVVHLPHGQELENLVSENVYFKALSECLGVETINSRAFKEWEKNENFAKQMMFTKRIDRWLQEQFPDTRYVKWVVMRRAIELEDLSQMNVAPLRQLVQNIVEMLRT